MDYSSVCAIIPIKHISERVPGKNYRDFGGKPLFTVILNTVLKSKFINHIIIDTNSPIIKSIIQREFNNSTKITVYDRPEHLWAGTTPVNLLLENIIESLGLKYDYFIQTHATNPLLTNDTLDRCIETLFEKQLEGYDSLFTVKKWQTRLYTLSPDGAVNALNHNPDELIPTQDLDPIYEENSCIYIFNQYTLLKRHHRIGYRPYIYIMNDIESTDIDTESDFKLASTLYQLELQNIHKIHKIQEIQETQNGNRIVLITGVNGDIGRAIANQFKSYNWTVIGIDRDNIPDNITTIDHFICKNLVLKDSVREIIDAIKEKYGRLDCIVNNAATQICKPLWELTEEDWDNTYDCNVKTGFLLAKYGLELLKVGKSGNIINIGSVHATSTSNNISAYSSSKAALVGLTRNMAIELAQFGIRVNSISPGAIDTKMLRSGLRRGHLTQDDTIDSNQKQDNDLVNKLGQKHLLGRVGTPENIADIVYYVVNNDFLTGSNLIIDGGATIRLSTE